VSTQCLMLIKGPRRERERERDSATAAGGTDAHVCSIESVQGGCLNLERDENDDPWESGTDLF
jgi:hypothetical protein